MVSSLPRRLKIHWEVHTMFHNPSLGNCSFPQLQIRPQYCRYQSSVVPQKTLANLQGTLRFRRRLQNPLDSKIYHLNLSQGTWLI